MIFTSSIHEPEVRRKGKGMIIPLGKESAVAKRISVPISQNSKRSGLKGVLGSGTSGFAIAGFVCSLVGLILVLLTGWPFLLGTAGVVFSAIGLGQTARGVRGKGFAIAGLIIGILDILIFWILVAIIGFAIAAML